MKNNLPLILAGILLLCVTYVIMWTIFDDSNRQANQRYENEQIARDMAAEHLATFNTAMAIGDQEKMCVEARVVMSWTIESHNVEAAKVSQKLVHNACGEQ